MGQWSAAGSGRGPRQTSVLLKNVLDTTWGQASTKIVCQMERFRHSIGRCYLEFVLVLLHGVLGVFNV